MKTESTLAIIKPNAIEQGNIGEIITIILKSGFRIAAIKMLHLSTNQSERLYEDHRTRPFFDGLVAYMSSAPVIALIVEKVNAVKDFRLLVGSTDPSEAAEGTIRRLFGASLRQNAIHGSDCAANARRETALVFSGFEIY